MLEDPVLLSRRALLLAGGLLAAGRSPAAASDTLLNVSYDVSREYFKDINAAFAAHWQASSGRSLIISQSHGGSSRQVRSVIDGLPADVVTMNQASDIQLLVDRGLINARWAERLPFGSAPTCSVSVILVRAGNPKGIRDWSDLGRRGVSVVMPNPKTSGNGRYAYLAAWGAALKAGRGAAGAQALLHDILANVPVLDGGSRASTTTFAARRIGDALITFESELPLIEREFGRRFEPLYPRWTVLAENPVAVVDKFVERRGTRALAEAYLQHLYSEPGQRIAAEHHLRPRLPQLLADGSFRPVQAFRVDELFGGWARVQAEHFADGGQYDRLVAAQHSS